jgi:hypothetical protein
MFYPADVSPIEPFSPLRFDPTSSLTQDVPPGKDVNCLLLGCGDPIHILFTIYNDERKGNSNPIHADLDFTRNLDFTCCDIEPAILGMTL